MPAAVVVVAIADLAVVKVAGVPNQQLRPLPLGTSDTGRLRVGQLCLTIGNRKCVWAGKDVSWAQTPCV